LGWGVGRRSRSCVVSEHLPCPLHAMVLYYFWVQAIPKFFQSFPALADQAMTAQFDLLEDSENAVRLKAIAALPQLCRRVHGLGGCTHVH
jgi:hypothetical protein